MHVVQILPELEGGGVEKGVLEVGAALAAAGHRSQVISAGGRMVAQLEREGSRHIRLPVHRKSLLSLRQVRPLRGILERERPDIVHVRSRLPAWLAWLAWRRMDPESRPRYLTTFHGFHSSNPYSRIMTRAERVICVSRSIRDHIRSSYPDVPPGRLQVIHRGIDPSVHPFGHRPDAAWLERWRREHPALEGKRLVVLPGRFTRLKGHLDFVRVLSRLDPGKLRVHGLMVGGTHPRKRGYLESVRAAVRKAGLEPHATLLPHRSDLREILATSEVVLSCSLQPEAFSRTTLEALSLGRPVLGYDHGGVREQLEILLPEGRIPPGDHRAMAERLARWLEGPLPVPRPNRRFTLERMLGQTLDLYQRMLGS